MKSARWKDSILQLILNKPTKSFSDSILQEINRLKNIWDGKEEILRNERHYHYHKTRSFYSLPEACKAIQISRVTFRKYEGKLFPHVIRDEAGRRLFTREDIEQIKEIWENHKKGK